MKYEKKSLIIISVLSIPLSASAALVPALASIGRAFPDWKDWLVYLITIPPLFIMVASFFTHSLLKFLSTKHLTIISILLIIISGVSPYFINDFVFLLITRAIIGLGLGILNTIVASLPAVYFPAGDKRDLSTGFQAAFISAGSVVFSLLSGKMATLNWRYVFLVQLINIIPLLICLVIMPTKTIEKTKNNEGNFSFFENFFVKEGLSIVILSFICVIITITYPLNLSLFTEKSGLGDANFVGLLSSINSAIGFFIGLAFAKILRKLKTYTLTIGLALTGISFFIISFSGTSFIMLLGSILFGIGTSLISPAFYSLLYEKVPSTSIVSAVGMMGVFSNLSQFVSPYIINPISAFFKEGEISRFLLSGTLTLFVTVFLFLKNMDNNKSKSS